MADNEKKIDEDTVEEILDNDTVAEEIETPEEDIVIEEVPEEDIIAEGCEETEKAEKTSKGFFQKKSREDKKADVFQQRLAELEDRNRRQLAEFENYRKRTEKEKEIMFETGAKSVIEKMLAVVDNFERGLAAVPEEEKDSAFVSGMEMVYKQLTTEFENLGVKSIEAVGQPFDPNLHNAVMQTESDEYESGIVAQELQKGYTYRDGVVRHSMVAVVQ